MVIREINNPMPILKQCNVFVLSSNYESLGLVLLEAATLGVPDIAAELLMNTYKGGYLAENSVEGICEGLEAYLRGEVGTMKIDWKQYNERAVAQFESLFD